MRFKFNSEWGKENIGNLIERTGKKAEKDELKYTPYSITNTDGFVIQSDNWEGGSYVQASKEGYKLIYNNEIAYNPARINVGSIGYFDKNVGIISSLYVCFKTKNKLHSKYLYHFMKSNIFRKIVMKRQEGGVRDYFFYENLCGVKISYPIIEEQEKIVSFLELINERISTQKKIIEDLIELKKGIINSTFNKYKYYKKIKLSMVLKERKKYAIKESNIIHATLSKEGIFPKTDRYNRDFLVKDEEKNYKISLLNDICYNPANLKFGVITRNKYGKCIISPIYITYEVDDKFLPDFVELYVCQNSFINYIRKYEQGTVYERMAVNSEDFLKGEIPFLSYEIQSLLVNKIKLIEEKIQNEKSILQLYIKEKEYFLNSLFI